MSLHVSLLICCLQRAELDIVAASKVLLRDWSSGKLKRYTMPSDGSTSSLPPTSDETIIAVLNTIPSRKEMKQDTGLIRLSSGPVDSRDVLFEAIYKAPEDSDSEEEEEFFGGGAVYSDEEFDEDMEDESMSEGSSSEEDAEEMEDVQKDIEPPSSRKQKRKREAQESEQGPKSKKVSFSVPDRKSKLKPVKQPPKKAPKPSPKKPVNATKSNVPAQDGERDYNFSTYF
jgi:nuclear GTP-binding protein